MLVALILVVVAIGSVAFHIVSPWWWTPIASNWGYVDDTLIITFWITGASSSPSLLFMAYCVWRFRHREGQQALYEPENKKLEWWLTVATAVGVVAMLAPGLLRLEPVRHGSGGRDRGRGRRPAMVMELPPAGQGRPARHLRRAQHLNRQSARPQRQ